MAAEMKEVEVKPKVFVLFVRDVPVDVSLAEFKLPQYGDRVSVKQIQYGGSDETNPS